MKRFMVAIILVWNACQAQKNPPIPSSKNGADFPAMGGPAYSLKEIERCRSEENFRVAWGNPNRVPPPAKPVTLRANPKNLTKKEYDAEVKKWNFFSDGNNPKGCFVNSFTSNTNGTVTDSVTGLLWEEMGTRNPVDYDSALAYVMGLNRDRFAGYADWRLPTCDELGSLMETPDGTKPWHTDDRIFLAFKSGWTSDSLVDKNRGQVYQWNMFAVNAHCYPFYRRYPPGKTNREDIAEHNVRAVRSLP